MKLKMIKQKLNLKIWTLAFLVLCILISSCKTETTPSSTQQNQNQKFVGQLNTLQPTDELKKFSSGQEIIDYIKSASMNQFQGGALSNGIARGGILSDVMMESKAAAPQTGQRAGNLASDYSHTNVQVAGVDEADFVKNDDSYIYVVTQNKLVIVDAYPPESGKIVSETKLDGNPRDIFVNKDRLVVFSEGNDNVPAFDEYDFIPRPRYVSITHALVYDISDRGKPKLVKDYNLNGYYLQSRMIGEQVYFIVQENVYYYNRLIDMPAIRQAGKTVVKPEVYYFDSPDYNYNFNTVASFNILGDEDKVNAKTFMMGYTGAIYVSENNIYLSYQKNYPYYYYEAHNEERFFKVVVPLLASQAQSSINDIKNDKGLNVHEKWEKISVILEDLYNGMDKEKKDNLITNIQNSIEEYEARLEQETRKTVIHKIKINNGNIDYDSRAQVPGYLLNQFSMDEYDGYLRVATTMEFYGISIMARGESAIEKSSGSAESASKIIYPKPPVERTNILYNNVYVLDSKMEIVGQLENIAQDERIYSTRFIGDKLYMVTFKRIDPLFVIGLSNPKKPEILGELKIPGFSDYLHPYDENHVIGIGKETGSNEWGGVSTKGVKLALFDVSDVKNPKQVDKYEIGEAGTDSEALRDHKAFLFDRKKNVLVIPVNEIKGKQYYDSKFGYYRQRMWQGAYVFGLTAEKGFELKGKITHDDNDERLDYYYYGSPYAVRRAIYMDDALYTVSMGKIKANNLNEIGREIKEIKLPYEREVPVYYGVLPSNYAKSSEGIAVEEHNNKKVITNFS